MRQAIPKIQTDDPDLSRVQDLILSALNPLLKESGGSTVPTGVILPFAGETAPTGFLVCDGAAVSRGAYAALFAVIGTTYGAGDGSSTFNLPDARGRAFIGVGQGSALSSRALGASGGKEAHALSEAELASHTHAATTGTESAQHTHGLGVGAADSSTVVVGTERFADHVGGYGATVRQTSAQLASHTHGVSVTATGSSTAHENMPPFLALNQIIKT